MLAIGKMHIILMSAAMAVSMMAFMWIKEIGAAREREKQYSAQVEAYKKDVAAANTIARQLEERLAALRDINSQLTKDIENENAPVYTACVVPDSGLRILNAARSAGSGTP